MHVEDGAALTAAPGWDDAATAAAYERFCAAHDRYARANAALVEHAALAAGQRVLDVGAGTGRTAEAVLAGLGASGRIVCVEPAAAMAALGRRRVADARVTWTAALPPAEPAFERVVCGASVWLLGELGPAVQALAARLRPGGALVFDLPALYLGEPDAPGGGADPALLGLPAAIVAARARAASGSQSLSLATALDADAVDTACCDAGLAPERWSTRVRLTQAAYRDWLKIPPVSEGLFPGVSAEARAAALDAAFARVDAGSWRWELWRGWTAWKR